MLKNIIIILLLLITGIVYADNQDILDKSNINTLKRFEWSTGVLTLTEGEKLKISVGSASKSYTVPNGKTVDVRVRISGTIQ